MNTATPRSYCDGGTVSYRKPLLFYGSPHEYGRTKRLIGQVLPYLPLDAEPEVIHAYNLRIRPCTDCRACYQGDCPLNEDGMGFLLNKFQDADLLISAAPVYFNGLPAPMKTIVDRSQQLFVRKFIQHESVFSVLKPGILLTTAGAEERFGNDGDGAMDGAYAVRRGSATNGVREIFRMFYGCLNTVLLGHIAITGTDKNPDFIINPAEINYLMKKLRDWKDNS